MNIAELRHRAEKRLYGAYEARIRQGITLGGTTLAADPESRLDIMQLLTTLREMEFAGNAPSDVTIIDVDGVERTISLAVARQALINYGNKFHTLRNLYKIRIGAIAVATTNAEILAVPVDFT